MYKDTQYNDTQYKDTQYFVERNIANAFHMIVFCCYKFNRAYGFIARF